MGRQARGRDLWGENPGVFFWVSGGPTKCVGGCVGGYCLRFQKSVQKRPIRSYLN